MKKTLIILTSFVLISCSSSENHADYEKNLEIAKKFISLHSSEDWEAQAELIHDDLSWSQPVYGSENYGKEGHIEAMKMYQSMFDNIKFEADYWLPGVDPETGMRDGAVRTYGTWTGVPTETGKEFRAPKDCFMVFPNQNAEPGQEWFYLGERI